MQMLTHLQELTLITRSLRVLLVRIFAAMPMFMRICVVVVFGSMSTVAQCVRVCVRTLVCFLRGAGPVRGSACFLDLIHKPLILDTTRHPPHPASRLHHRYLLHLLLLILSLRSLCHSNKT